MINYTKVVLLNFAARFHYLTAFQQVLNISKQKNICLFSVEIEKSISEINVRITFYLKVSNSHDCIQSFLLNCRDLMFHITCVHSLQLSLLTLITLTDSSGYCNAAIAQSAQTAKGQSIKERRKTQFFQSTTRLRP